jgi:hypothetical protein
MPTPDENEFPVGSLFRYCINGEIGLVVEEFVQENKRKIFWFGSSRTASINNNFIYDCEEIYQLERKTHWSLAGGI